MKKILLAILPLTIYLNAQDLKTSINETLLTHPSIKEKFKNYNLTREEINLAKSGYYPKIDLSFGGGYETTNKSQSPTIESSSVGLLLYQSSLKYTQNIFKGFQTKYKIIKEQHRISSSAYSYIEKVNDLSFEMVDIYLKVMRNKELLENTKENVTINQDILKKVEKLYESGLTNLSEVNKIESSLALAKSNQVVQENTLLDLKYNIETLLGHNVYIQQMSRPELNVALPNGLNEAIEYTLKNNISLTISNYNIKLAQATYKENQSFLYPNVDVEITKSINKNLNGSETKNDAFKAMALVSFNLFNGFNDTTRLRQEVTKIYTAVEQKNSLRRKVIEDLKLSWLAYEKLNEQLIYLKEYQKFSIDTLDLYSKEYDLGRRSLLDLLSAQNDFIGSKSQIINTNYSILFAKYRILNSLGTLVETVLGDTDTFYKNVGLIGNQKIEEENLPIYLDNDNDLVPNDIDICTNSRDTEMKNLLGCKLIDNNITQIQRFSGFLFEQDINITEETKFKIDSLIHQLHFNGFEKVAVDIFGNAVYKDLTDTDLVKLSQERADFVKNIFIRAGVEQVNIKTYANSDKYKLFLDDEAQNNRVDIIIKKIK